MYTASSISGKKNCKYTSSMNFKKDENNMPILPTRRIKTEPYNALKINLKKRCIVYTTKLDDMRTFKTDLKHVTIKKIYDSILKESSPRLGNVQPYIYPSFGLQKKKYKEMVKTLENIKRKFLFLSTVVNKSEINTDDIVTRNSGPKSNSETNLVSGIVKATVATTFSKKNTKHIPSDSSQCEKIEVISKFCKPARVAITDYYKSSAEDISSDENALEELNAENLTYQRPTLPTRNMQYLGAFEQFIKLSDVTDKQNSFPRSCKKTNQQTMTNRVIVITNQYSNDVDIYWMNQAGCLVYYYKTNQTKVKDVLSKFPDITYPIRNEICCWYQREEFITMLGAKFINVATQRFMRKPHICFPGWCTCCCKKDNLNRVKKSNSATVTNHPSFLGEDLIDLENEISNTIIEMKAKNSALKSDNNNLKSLSTKILNLPTSQTTDLSFEKTKNNSLKNIIIINNDVPKGQREWYELGPEGHLTLYLKWRTEIDFIPKKLTDLKIQRITHTVCCWVQREIKISKLIDLGLSYSAVKFLRSSHICQYRECSCCCPKNILYNGSRLNKLVDINLPKRASHFKINLKSISNNSRQDKTPSNYGTDKSQLKSSPSLRINNIERKNDNCTKYHEIDLRELLKRNSEKNANSPKVPRVYSAVQQCISTILSTFEGARLTVNNEGTVAAILNTSVNSLSTSELKILASIISCAQNGVDAMGLFPKVKTENTLLTTKNVQVLGVFPGTKPVISYHNTTKSVQKSNTQTNFGTTTVNSNSARREVSHNKQTAYDFSTSLMPYERKRKIIEEQSLSQKKVKSVFIPSALDNLGVSTLQNLGAVVFNRNENVLTKPWTGTLSTEWSSKESGSLSLQSNVSTKTDSSETKINNISTPIPCITQKTNQQSQSGSILSALLCDTIKQNQMYSDLMTTSAFQAVGYIAPGSSISGKTAMLLVTPLMFAPSIPAVTFRDDKIKSESVISGNNTMDFQMTNVSDLSPLVVKSEIETFDNELEVVENFNVKNEECILGV